MMKKLFILFSLFVCIQLLNAKVFEINYALVKTNDVDYDKFLSFVKKVLVEISSTKEYKFNVKLINKDEVLKAFEKKEFDVMLCSPEFYFENKKELASNIRNIYTNPEGKTVVEEYYLLKNINNPNTFMNQKKLTIHYPLIYRSTKIWLDMLIYENHKKSFKEVIFKSKRYSKEGKIAYKVFFDKNAFGIITKNTYELVMELNPQIRKQVKIIKKSKPMFISTIFLEHNKVDSKRSKKLIDFINNKDGFLGNTKNSQGILLSKISLVKEEDLEIIEAYYKKHKILQKKYEK